MHMVATGHVSKELLVPENARNVYQESKIQFIPKVHVSRKHHKYVTTFKSPGKFQDSSILLSGW